MVEQNPLAIKYTLGEQGVFFGWSIEGPEQVNPGTIPVFSADSVVKISAQGESLPKAVHREVLVFFNGSLSADLNIPSGYPYEFYEPEKDSPSFTGPLRDPEIPR